MLYGEVFAHDIHPECDPDCTVEGECQLTKDGRMMVPCRTGRWITPLVMTVYLLFANILLINLLIASFNTIYNSVSSSSQHVWNFQRFSVVLEYVEKPVLPPPLTVFSHIFRLAKVVRRCCWTKSINTNMVFGLKVLLSKFSIQRLYDFEEECQEGMIKTKDAKQNQKLDARVKYVQDTLEELKVKVEDLDRWETMNAELNQGMGLRLQRMEETDHHAADRLAIIHKLLARLAGTTGEVEPSVAGSRRASSITLSGNILSMRKQSPVPGGPQAKDNVAVDVIEEGSETQSLATATPSTKRRSDTVTDETMSMTSADIMADDNLDVISIHQEGIDDVLELGASPKLEKPVRETSFGEDEKQALDDVEKEASVSGDQSCQLDKVLTTDTDQDQVGQKWKEQAHLLMAAWQRRRIQDKRKNYTSITDRLEMMATLITPPQVTAEATSAIEVIEQIETPLMVEITATLGMAPTTVPVPEVVAGIPTAVIGLDIAPPLPTVQIQTELLQDAERAEHELMEPIIDKRLQRLEIEEALKSSSTTPSSSKTSKFAPIVEEPEPEVKIQRRHSLVNVVTTDVTVERGQGGFSRDLKKTYSLPMRKRRREDTLQTELRLGASSYF